MRRSALQKRRTRKRKTGPNGTAVGRGPAAVPSPVKVPPTEAVHSGERARPTSDGANGVGAPAMGFLVLDPGGRIRRADTAVEAMLRASEPDLAGRPLSELIRDGGTGGGERSEDGSFLPVPGGVRKVALLRGDGSTLDACLLPCTDASDGEPSTTVAIVDTADRALIRNFLRAAARAKDTQTVLNRVTGEIKAFLGCDAVGIRLLDAEGNIPYQACDGFTREFYAIESPLSIHRDRCLCTGVIKGLSAPSRALATPLGAIRIDSTTRLLQEASAPPSEDARNTCHHFGFESVALVPIAAGGLRLGLIHAADRRVGLFSSADLEMLEALATALGMMLQRAADHTLMQESLQELQFVSSKLLQVQEEEQRRISMELHDHAGQNLNFLKFQLSNLTDLLPKNHKRLETEFGRLLSLVDTVIDDIRRLSHGLSPSILENLGLYAALESLVDDFSSYSGIRTRAHLQDLADLQFDPQTQIAVYRIVQELLSNVRKHAGARRVTIDVERNDHKLFIRVRDNGRGFRLRPKPAPDGLERGLGLATMQLRARVIGATLLFNSQIGRGTETILTVPIDRGVSRP